MIDAVVQIRNAALSQRKSDTTRMSILRNDMHIELELPQAEKQAIEDSEKSEVGVADVDESERPIYTDRRYADPKQATAKILKDLSGLKAILERINARAERILLMQNRVNEAWELIRLVKEVKSLAQDQIDKLERKAVKGRTYYRPNFDNKGYERWVKAEGARFITIAARIRDRAVKILRTKEFALLEREAPVISPSRTDWGWKIGLVV